MIELQEAGTHFLFLSSPRGVVGFSVLLAASCSPSVSSCAFPSTLWFKCTDMWMTPRSPQSLPWSPGTDSLPALPAPASAPVLRLDDRESSLSSPLLSPHPEHYKPRQPHPKIAWNPSLLSISNVFALIQPLLPLDSNHTLSYLKLCKMAIPCLRVCHVPATASSISTGGLGGSS